MIGQINDYRSLDSILEQESANDFPCNKLLIKARTNARMTSVA